MTLRAALVGTTAATTAASGTITLTAAMSGTTAAVSGATGTLALVAGLSGVADAASSTSGILAALLALSGTVAALSDTTGTINLFVLRPPTPRPGLSITSPTLSLSLAAHNAGATITRPATRLEVTP